MQLQVEKAIMHHHQYLDMPDEEHNPLPDVTIPETQLSFRWSITTGTHWKVTGPH
jgi:hypothetical protein